MARNSLYIQNNVMSWPSQFAASPSDQPGESSDGPSTRLDAPDSWACGDDSPSMRNALELAAWWRCLEKRGGLNLWESGSLGDVVVVLCGWLGPEQVFWCAEKNPKEILRPQTPLSYPSQKKNSTEWCDSWNCAKIRAKKNAVNIKIRQLYSHKGCRLICYIGINKDSMQSWLCVNQILF